MERSIVGMLMISLALACNPGKGPGETAAEVGSGVDTADGGTADSDGGGESATSSGTATAGVDGSEGGVDDGVDDGTDDGGVDGGSQCDTDSDCPDGMCVELVPGGVRVCVVTPFEATDCPLDPNGDELPHQCCETPECKAGICVGNIYGPQCSGAKQVPLNICATDECTTHADCGAGGACIPAGALGFPVASCLQVACLQHADCTDRPGGVCVIEPSTTCCGDAQPRCRYPDSPPIGDECPP